MSQDVPNSEDQDIAEFEAAMGPHVDKLSPEMYNLRLVLFSATKDEAAAKRKKVTDTVEEPEKD